MRCSKCRKDVLALMPGGVCPKCYVPNHRPAPAEQPTSQRRKCVVEHNGLFRQAGDHRPKWGPRSTAKVYTSEARARASIRQTGKGKVENAETTKGKNHELSSHMENRPRS